MKIIGICGGSGSGKTTLLRRIANQYSQMKPTVFSMDNYYKPLKEQQRDKNGEVNFDLPTALNKEQMILDIEKLMSGKSIEVIEYHFNAHSNSQSLITLEPSQLLIIEGLFVFEYQELNKLLDYSIFVEVDLDVQLDRRLYRDQETRGYSHEAILYQWNNHVLPCYKNYLQPYKESADFCFLNDNQHELEFERLKEELSSLLV
jgi:uridine kinase